MNSLARRLASTAMLFLLACSSGAQEHKRITFIYDAFGPDNALQKDWGFAALVEYDGRRVLFDTGNDAGIFEHNVRQLGIDLARLDAVVISHRHGDHTSGLSHLLDVNPDVIIYAPQEGAFFKSKPPQGFLEPHFDLPRNLRYYEGKKPERWVSGTPWEDGNFEVVMETREIFPGFYVLTTQSQRKGTIEMNEVSLAVRTPEGLAVIVGCSHPGVENILQEATRIAPEIYTVAGGFHLVLTAEEEVQRVAKTLHDTLRLERVAPSHCTSELGFATFIDVFKERFDEAGVGTSIQLP